MTLDDLEYSLPNGLHDAELRGISVDYQQRTMTIDLAVFVGELDAPPEKREAYRDALVIISGLQFATVESPDSSYPFSQPGASRIDACDMSKNLEPSLLKTLPKGAFCRSFFVNEWNAFIHVAGLGAEIEWKTPVAYRNEPEHHLPGETIDL
jgi:hypothetical protein